MENNFKETDMLRQQPFLMVVVPCYDEAEGLEHTADVLGSLMQGMKKAKSISSHSSICFIDDGSTDGTWNVIERLHLHEPDLFHGVKLAHNRGHQNALLAGLTYAYESGADAVVSMDADLQDDPTAMKEMVEEYRHGAEVVYGVRDNRDTDTAFKRGTAAMFYRAMSAMGAETIPDHADYRLLSRRALGALLEYKEDNLFLRGIVPSIGFPSAKVYYRRGERTAGESKYPLRKMVSFAIEGITSFSAKPLHVITALGMGSLVVAIAMLIYTIVSVCDGHAVAGWGSIMVSLWFIGSLVLLSLGVIGEYLAKVYTETKRRPRFVIEETI